MEIQKIGKSLLASRNKSLLVFFMICDCGNKAKYVMNQHSWLGNNASPQKKKVGRCVFSLSHIAVGFCFLGSQYFSDMQGCFSNPHSQCWRWRHPILTKYIRQRYRGEDGREEAVGWHDRCRRGPEHRDGACPNGSCGVVVGGGGGGGGGGGSDCRNHGPPSSM